VTSPHQRRVVQEMETQLESPAHSVSRRFLEILAFNKARLTHPELFGKTGKNGWNEEWEAASCARNAAFLTSFSQYTGKLLAAIPEKNETAQRDSLREVLLVLSRWDLPGKETLQRRAIDDAVLL
jgi:hypothetical protein